jgi:cellulose synthase/poly-beta-1,6-N-acetylglucosamine synthase-like glycosyltransferase
MTTALLILGFVALLLAMHPFVSYPCSLLMLKALRNRRRPRLEAAHRPLTFAICMCAYNEEAVIEAKVANLLRLKERHPDLKILIYVDASSDRTAALLQPHRAVIDLHVAAERHGKTHGMNLLAARTDADVLVFTDANVVLDMSCIDDLTRHFADPEAGCVCGNLNYTNGSTSVTASSGTLYWRFEEAVKRLETETGSALCADGSIFAIRRALRRAPPDHIIDDMYVSLMVLVDGYRVVQARDVRAYEASATDVAEEFGRKVRIACQAFNVHRLLWPRLRKLDALTRYKYVSHKLLRWLGIYFLTLAAGAFIAAAVAAGHTASALTGIALVLIAAIVGYRWSVKPIAQLVDLIIAIAGAGVGVWRSVRGERFQTWTPASSVREA